MTSGISHNRSFVESNEVGDIVVAGFIVASTPSGNGVKSRNAIVVVLCNVTFFWRNCPIYSSDGDKNITTAPKHLV